MTGRIPLICSPTPLHPLERLSAHLGCEIWIKRDDLTGFAGGGNKGRKLEFLMAEALRLGADTIVTRGAWQSNWIRQCAAACRVFGIEFHAAAVLNKWTGADVHFLPDMTFDQVEEEAQKIAEDLRAKGRNVFSIPGGGSTPIGAQGFIAALDEIAQQQPEFDQIVFASGSGGTQTGLTYGGKLKSLKTRMIGICTDDEPEMVEDFALIANGLDKLLGESLSLRARDFWLTTDYAGGGYQVPSKQTQDAMQTLVDTEGIFLDPVYTGKAFEGLLGLAKAGELPGRTLFWHTGGFPVLFADGRLPREW
jgi:1-aminocyclopropane-1-carboxylate deaminase/D-cysteine desulfhydrase-like pyridoxal-dependent ACC family enzyme